MTSRRIGATNQFPYRRKLRSSDRGGLVASIAVMRDARMIRLDFGEQVDYVLTPPEMARAQADAWRKLVARHFGQLRYVVGELSIKVRADQASGMVESRLPCPAHGVLANPEVFLAWAQRLDEAAAELVQTRH